MARILYISYTGLSDALGQSQVLQYLKYLAVDHEVTLLTFENPEKVEGSQMMERIAVECRDNGIDWHYLTYHNTPRVPATLWDVGIGSLWALWLARRMKAEILHTRSYIPGLMAMLIKRLTGAGFLFDIRGFWPDEAVDGGSWKRDSRVYRTVKWLEKRLFLNADHVISLTHSGKHEIEKFPYLQGRAPQTTVIPTCTNLEVFRPLPTGSGDENGTFVLGYVGSVGTWYMFPEIVRAVGLLFNKDPDARFLIVNKGGHADITSMLTAEGVDMTRVEIVEAAYQDVPHYINRMSAGIFFIKPFYSKKASCPTRMGEFLACGKPCLANAGVGDVQRDLDETGTGIVVTAFDDAVLEQALEQIRKLSAEDGVDERCRQAAEERFALSVGVKRYAQVYRQMIEGTGRSR